MEREGKEDSPPGMERFPTEEGRNEPEKGSNTDYGLKVLFSNNFPAARSDGWFEIEREEGAYGVPNLPPSCSVPASLPSSVRPSVPPGARFSPVRSSYEVGALFPLQMGWVPRSPESKWEPEGKLVDTADTTGSWGRRQLFQRNFSLTL